MTKLSGSDTKSTLYCSFCGKSQHEVRKLIVSTCAMTSSAKKPRALCHRARMAKFHPRKRYAMFLTIM
jgi:ribosomal protein L37E